MKPQDRFEVLLEDLHEKMDIVAEGSTVMREDISMLKAHAVRVDQKFTVLTTEVLALKDGVTELKGDMQELKIDVGELKHDVGELKHDVSELKDDVGGLKVDMKVVKHVVQQHSRELAQLQT